MEFNMSHVAAGFTVTDIEALKQAVEENCPTLQLVQKKDYRTWVADNGKLVGDYALPAIYQLKVLSKLGQQGIDYDVLAAGQGVQLPENTLDLEKKPWTLAEQNKLMQHPKFKEAYDQVVKQEVGKDAEYVITTKGGIGKQYEIGIVPNPASPGEYTMICDFWQNGNGILNHKGVGRHVRVEGKDDWGHELKCKYSEIATERVIQAQIAAGNPDYASVVKKKLPNGQIQYEVHGRE